MASYFIFKAARKVSALHTAATKCFEIINLTKSSENSFGFFPGHWLGSEIFSSHFGAEKNKQHIIYPVKYK